jgi:hypothetical protein
VLILDCLCCRTLQRTLRLQTAPRRLADYAYDASRGWQLSHVVPLYMAAVGWQGRLLMHCCRHLCVPCVTGGEAEGV